MSSSTTSSDSQKQLFSLIRDFATEKSQGERRVSSLKKRIEELQSQLETANAERDNHKRVKETLEQEIKGYEVEVSMSDASILTLEARIASVQDEVSKVGADIEVLKKQEAAQRDEFIRQMIELKAKIREFHESALLSSQQKSCHGTSENEHKGSEHTESIDVEKEISIILGQIEAEEEEFVREQNLHNKLHQELVDQKRKLELIEAIRKEIKELQDLTKQTSELEEKCGFLSEELQRRCFCPTCQLDNSEVLAAALQHMVQHQ